MKILFALTWKVLSKKPKPWPSSDSRRLRPVWRTRTRVGREFLISCLTRSEPWITLSLAIISYPNGIGSCSYGLNCRPGEWGRTGRGRASKIRACILCLSKNQRGSPTSLEKLTCHMVASSILLDVPAASFSGILLCELANGFSTCCILHPLLFLLFYATIKLVISFSSVLFSFMEYAHAKPTCYAREDVFFQPPLVYLSRAAMGSHAPTKLRVANEDA